MPEPPEPSLSSPGAGGPRGRAPHSWDALRQPRNTGCAAVRNARFPSRTDHPNPAHRVRNAPSRSHLLARPAAASRTIAFGRAPPRVARSRWRRNARPRPGGVSRRLRGHFLVRTLSFSAEPEGDPLLRRRSYRCDPLPTSRTRARGRTPMRLGPDEAEVSASCARAHPLDDDQPSDLKAGALLLRAHRGTHNAASGIKETRRRESRVVVPLLSRSDEHPAVGGPRPEMRGR